MFPFPLPFLANLRVWEAVGAAAMVMAVALSLFLAGRSSGVKAEQRRTDPQVVRICEAAGATWQEVDVKGKALPRAKWGRACAAAVADLTKFKGDALAEKARLLAEHAAEETKKTAADQADAARRSSALAQARRNMESANAAVKNDRVDGGWFARLNELGGLRDPAGKAQPRGPRPTPHGQPSS